MSCATEIAAEPPVETVHLKVWDWLDAVAANPGLKAGAVRFAMTIPRYSENLSGVKVWIDRDGIARMLHISDATVTRRIRDLVAAGHLIETQRSAPGQRPLYMLTGPDRFRGGAARSPETPINSDQERDQRSPINSRRVHDQRREGTSRTTERERDGRSTSNARQKPGITLITSERERDDQRNIRNKTSSSSGTAGPEMMMMSIDQWQTSDLEKLSAEVETLRPDWDSAGIVAAIRRHLGELTIAEASQAARDAANNPEARTPEAFKWHRDRRRAQPSAEIHPTCTHCNRPRPICQQVQQKTGDRHPFQPDMQIGAQS